MRAFVALFLILVSAAQVSARTVTNSAGRKVEIPDRIEKVFAAGPPASILLYILAPEKMTGWPDPPRGEERPFIAPAYRDLPRSAVSPGGAARPISRSCSRPGQI